MSPGRLTLLIKGGTIYDGTGSDPVVADVGIRGDTVVLVGDGAAHDADTVIHASGFSVSPGFIDTHGHSEFTLLAEPSAEGKVLQGVTTEINGNCGLSAAPLQGDALAQRETDLKSYGIKERWTSFEEYFDLLEARGLALNFATLTGHGNIRASVMGYASRRPDADEIKRMKLLLKETLDAGSLGLSTGLIYPPGVYSETAELVELSRSGASCAGERFIYTSHMRSEGQGLLEAVEETLRIGREAGVKVHISHIKTATRENWHKADLCISMLEEARSRGMEVTCDRYPYTAGSTDLDSVLPSWAFEGGSSRELQRLSDPDERERIKAELEAADDRWEEVRISEVASGKNKWMEGKSVLEAARAMRLSPRDLVISVLVDEELRVGAIFHSMSEENLVKFLSLPYCMVGSDSSARSFKGPTRKGKPHPRGFGSFPRFLKNYANDLPKAIHKITALPALTFGLKRRGYINEGYYADMTIFNPDELADMATFDEPFQKPQGIYCVIVNGRVVASRGEMTHERPGVVLRGG